MSGTIDLTLGHSPDPDDAFMFYALAKDKIDTGGYRFEHELVDIETLNRRAVTGALDELRVHARILTPDELGAHARLAYADDDAHPDARAIWAK